MRPIPRVSTRGRYDLTSGKKLRQTGYYLYPAKSFRELHGKKEIAIMIHGLRNDRAGAASKFEIAQKKLRSLGYEYPVIGYSYDSNTRGAHLKKTELRALRAGQKIARQNGADLARFLRDFGKKSPNTRFRLLGHSLGSQVILAAIDRLAGSEKNRGVIESVHFFGASIPAGAPGSQRYAKKIRRVVRKKITNYYAPTDEVLLQAHSDGSAKYPLGLYGAIRRPASKYVQKKVRPKNHRFKSYAQTMRAFP